MKPIPVSEAKDIAKAYGYDQVIIMARKTGDDGGETVTTAGADQQHCDIAARIGDHLKFDLLKWARDDTTIHEDRTSAAEIKRLRIQVERQRKVLDQAELVLDQAKDCINAETPEDITFGEAEDDTISKIRDAMRDIAAVTSDDSRHG